MPGHGSRRPRDSADEALIRSLYNEHGRAVLAYATRLTGDAAAAEDVLQETLIRAWNHPDVLVNGKGSVRGWLLTTARNIATDRFRARKARPTEVADTQAVHPAERDHADRVVDMVAVMEGLDRLSDDHREALVQVYLRGHSVGEAAQALGVPAGTVKSRCHHALRALRGFITAGPATGKGGIR